MKTKEIVVPDIGDFDEVEIIELLVAVGDTIAAEDSLITVESDKASMEIPSSDGGVVKEVKVAIGDMIKEGSIMVVLETTQSVLEEEPEEEPAPPPPPPPPPKKPKPLPEIPAKPSPTIHIDEVKFSKAYATPSQRRFARDLGVDLGNVKGSGRKGRITRQDIKSYVKTTISAATSGGGSLGVAPMPEIDFSQWGDIESVALSKINKLTGEFLHRNWVTIPHVTQYDEADITEMEAFRKQMGTELKDQGVKITPLAFIMKAVIASLKAFPRFNSSLDASKENLIQKHYYHIGVAVDTPDGLVVPVIRDADQKSLVEISQEIREFAIKARDKKLKPSDMQGGCFSISSLGGIGGTKFTPIINAPEVAILGVSRSSMQPIWNGNEFEPRLMLPLSLSYDHRVIDGAAGARFTTHLSKQLSDIRRLLL
ncbi:MAG: Dihydrolipoamide acetyltransferase component of pyruvate dehydrogenase complex (EC [uncultured Thiotrichaceae bacterium]|uniref:Acetyltransferase component of pyruvate dehydrogenase complex n=1 Tax=uncultured Thiotrichaceae bacterium TaxID=298394 RepID=A0A6S6SVU2_9GAMM|nr:MAG: Dihydrolipoamide acetyltransferase component of pyruvate dehydrogenase complex (EC [uncultured Thiotrichaceae bacterium]